MTDERIMDADFELDKLGVEVFNETWKERVKDYGNKAKKVRPNNE